MSTRVCQLIKKAAILAHEAVLHFGMMFEIQNIIAIISKNRKKKHNMQYLTKNLK
jgi:hypothetical protein